MTVYRALWSNLKTGVMLGELPVTSLTVTKGLNQAGSFKATVPLTGKGIDYTLAPAMSAVHLERDGIIIGSGILWRADANFDTDSLDLAGEGWHSYFRHRYIRDDLYYAAGDQLGIARNLIQYAQLGQGNIGILVPVQTSGVLRDRQYYGFERKNIAEAVEQLAAVENGFDWFYDSAWSGNTVATTFRMQYPATGTRSDILFEVGKNCQSLSLAFDASQMANSVDALGAGEGQSMLAMNRQDASAFDTYPLLEQIVTFKDITELPTLSLHAGRALMRGHERIIAARIAVHPSVEPAIGSYSVGDQCRLIAKRGWANVDTSFRIVSQTLNLDESTGEQVQLDLAPLEMFDAV